MSPGSVGGRARGQEGPVTTLRGPIEPKEIVYG